MILSFLSFLCGLFLFLFGMKKMSEGLEKMGNASLICFLEKMTDTKIKAILSGIMVTSLIQSSSAMSVLLIGLLNAKIISLNQATWTIMGANIGTTLTAWMLSLDIMEFAPFFILIGFIFLLFKKIRLLGRIIGGVGILFLGMNIMGYAFTPLKDSSFLLSLLHYASHPFLGVLIGCMMAMLIQSSSACMGILQTLGRKEMVNLFQCAYLIFGFEIGTCFTSFLASLSGCQESRQLSLFHLFFNCIGTFLFILLCVYTPFLDWFSLPLVRSVAYLQTLFNIITTIIVCILNEYLLKIVCFLLPMK